MENSPPQKMTTRKPIVGERPVWPDETRRLMLKLAEISQAGFFMTGIEGSEPMVQGRRRDQFKEAGDFYLTYNERLEKIADIGITWLRLGPPYSKTHLGPNQYDFDWFDGVIQKCQQLKITVLLDLLHFGLPAWQHAKNPDQPFFQNPDFPCYFQEFVNTIVRRYPHIHWFTPVNEPFITASFSGLQGMWNEGRADQRSFFQASFNCAKAAILARQTIDQIWQDEKRPGEPLYVQNESFEETIAAPASGREKEAAIFNDCYRFLSLDLIFGHQDPILQEYLLKAEPFFSQDYAWCMKNGNARRSILGIDYYPWCLHTLYADHKVDHDPTMSYELYRLTKAYWQRYQLPLLHTEVNAWPDFAHIICNVTYDEISKLRLEGFPVLGMTWYGDESQMDWQSGLVRFNEETPVGLFRQGEEQQVAKLYRDLAKRGFPNFEF